MEEATNSNYIEITYQEAIDDLQRVAGILSRKTVTLYEYEDFGKYPYYKIKLLFGGWNQALKAAGLRKGRLMTYFTKEELIEDLHNVMKILGHDRFSLRQYNLYGKHFNWHLVEHFGCFTKALKAAKLKSYQYNDATEEELIAELLRIKDILGRTPISPDLKKPLTNYTYHIFKKTFGTWNNTLRKIGLGENIIYSKSDEELIENLIDIYHKIGRVPKSFELADLDSKFSYQIYISKFGSWKNAILTSELVVNSKTLFTEKEIIDNYFAVSKKLNRSPTQKEFVHPLTKINKQIYLERYGSWSKAKEFMKLQETIDSNCIKITYKEAVDDLQRVAKKLKLKTITISDYENLGKYPYYEVKLLLGGWNEAMKAAKLTICRKRTNPTNDELIYDMKKVAKLLNNNSFAQKEYKIYGRYFSWLPIKRFGSWNNALRAAGLKVYGWAEISEEDLIAEILRIKQQLGRVPKITDIKKPLSKYSHNIYGYVFGSWNNALLQAGLEININQGISNEELADNLKEVCAKLGRVPIQTEVRRPLSKYSCHMYELRFGSWNKTLKALGYPVNHRIKISDEEIIENYREVSRKLNRTPSYDEFLPPLTKISMKTYVRRFGSWSKTTEYMRSLELKTSKKLKK